MMGKGAEEPTSVPIMDHFAVVTPPEVVFVTPFRARKAGSLLTYSACVRRLHDAEQPADPGVHALCRTSHVPSAGAP